MPRGRPKREVIEMQSTEEVAPLEKDYSEVLRSAWKRVNPEKHYYKSECRPLGELVKLWDETFETHGFTFPKWLEIRDRARKDLFWLGRWLIGTAESGSGFVEHVHREMCEQCVPKNFDGVYHDDYTLEEVRAAIDKQDRDKEALFLCPTGAYKSTVNKVDCAQWMLNVPDVRIFIITGSGTLSKKFLKEVKGFFHRASLTTPLTRFQSFFPEYVILGNDGDTFAPLFCPARIHTQPGTPSLWVNSIDGAIAGWHCDIWKGDDIVNEDNSNNDETREKLKNRYDNLTQNRPDKWAFKDHFGTRYYPGDWYGTRIDEWKKYPTTNPLRYLSRSAWTVKKGFELVPIRELQEHMVDLYFPEIMPFNLLMQQCRANEQNFRCQKLNEPAAGDMVVNFTQEDIETHTIVLTKVPRPDTGTRRIRIYWDTAHTDGVTSDYSAGAAGYCHEETRSLYVLGIRFGKWKDSEVAENLVAFHWEWGAELTEIEKFSGWELFAAEVQRVSQRKHGKYLPLLWRTPEQGSGAKRNRVKGLETLIAADRLWFVDGDWMDTTTKQFTKFTGLSKKKKDDIPDAVSGLQRMIPGEVVKQFIPTETEAQRKEREAAELIEKFNDQQKEFEYRNFFALPVQIPASQPQRASRTEEGPGRVFGGNGMHL